jgi:hypothetical protein
VHPWPTSPDVRLKTEEEGRVEGEKSARADIARGVIGWRTLGGWGLPGPHADKYVDMTDVLERDFAIKVHRTTAGSGCFPPPDEQYLRARTTSYNVLMKPLIVAKHGDKVFELAEQRAKAETKAKIETAERNEADCRSGKGAKCGDGCDPPWFVQADGIKRYKPACL